MAGDCAYRRQYQVDDRVWTPFLTALGRACVPHMFLAHAAIDTESAAQFVRYAAAYHGITYWIDAERVAVGDIVWQQIGRGFRVSELVGIWLPCADRPWPGASSAPA